jgi:hypothetical protein
MKHPKPLLNYSQNISSLLTLAGCSILVLVKV